MHYTLFLPIVTRNIGRRLLVDTAGEQPVRQLAGKQSSELDPQANALVTPVVKVTRVKKVSRTRCPGGFHMP